MTPPVSADQQTERVVSLDARAAAAVHYPDPISALRIAFERGWDAHAAAVGPGQAEEADRMRDPLTRVLALADDLESGGGGSSIFGWIAARIRAALDGDATTGGTA